VTASGPDAGEVWDRLAVLPPVADGAALKAAVLVPLYEDELGDVRVVLTKRPDTMRTHAGDVVFPGGRIEPTDDGPVAAALRETWEEVGIPPELVTVIGGLAPVSTRSAEMLVAPVVGRLDRPPELVPDPAEVEVVIEPTLAELTDDSNWVQEDFYGHPLWFYEFPDGMLWGATAFMVRQLLEYLR
jgi:8-oxo-dGTP pyrophosphatase MutT (NUDIX family)